MADSDLLFDSLKIQSYRLTCSFPKNFQIEMLPSKRKFTGSLGLRPRFSLSFEDPVRWGSDRKMYYALWSRARYTMDTSFDKCASLGFDVAQPKPGVVPGQGRPA